YLGVFTALYFFAGQQRISNSSWFYTSVVALFLLHGPFLYAYTTVLTTGKKKLVKNDVLHFIPCFLFLIYLAIAFQFPTYSAGITLDHVHTALRPPILFVLFLLLTAASGPIYFYLSLLRVKDYKIRIQNNFSALDQANLEWLKILLLIFGVVWTVLILIAIAHHIFHFSSMDFCINGLFASLSVFIVLLGYFGFRQQEIFRHIPAEGFLEPDSIPLETEKSTQKTSEKYRGMYMSPEEMDAYVRRINQFMEEQ
ncbi:MAG TPA: hypothetical protein VFD72_02240, partial [Sphingobacteriaceae bacterium]|nr:hypothetical protein [Sphingobacteriaceae bacterium]